MCLYLFFRLSHFQFLLGNQRFSSSVGIHIRIISFVWSLWRCIQNNMQLPIHFYCTFGTRLTVRFLPMSRFSEAEYKMHIAHCTWPLKRRSLRSIQENSWVFTRLPWLCAALPASHSANESTFMNNLKLSRKDSQWQRGVSRDRPLQRTMTGVHQGYCSGYTWPGNVLCNLNLSITRISLHKHQEQTSIKWQNSWVTG